VSGSIVGATARQMGSQATPILEMRGISKSFAAVQAVKDVDLSVVPGETVGIVGENGAGKSTLMKMIAGVYPASSFEGELVFEGRPRHFKSVRDAEAAGIVLVPQELHIAPNLSIAENMFMGMLPGSFGLVDERKLRALAGEQLRFFGITVRPEAQAGILSPSEQRLVTIASALTKSARLIILDEPTAALTEQEAQHLFDHIRRVRDQGVACLYISHRLDEIELIADRVVVMRNGKIAGHFDQVKGQREEMVHAMIGREAERAPTRTIAKGAAPILSVEDMVVRDPYISSKLRVNRVSFALKRGEILGLFGLVGAGRTELAQAIFGVWPGEVEGKVTVEGREHRPRSPREAIGLGIGMLTENRKQTGLIEGQTVNANISAASLDEVSGALLVNETRERDRNRGLARQLDLRPPRLDFPVEAFSGGNQQKILLARWLAIKPRILILDEPTLGVDIGARFELYRLIRALADDGRGVLMISSDLNEVLDECDRILVMYKGRITGEFEHGAARHALMAAATGEAA
jgi:ABC-type sugar transport system ATPase subunit